MAEPTRPPNEAERQQLIALRAKAVLEAEKQMRAQQGVANMERVAGQPVTVPVVPNKAGGGGMTTATEGAPSQPSISLEEILGSEPEPSILERVSRFADRNITPAINRGLDATFPVRKMVRTAFEHGVYPAVEKVVYQNFEPFIRAQTLTDADVRNARIYRENVKKRAAGQPIQQIPFDAQAALGQITPNSFPRKATGGSIPSQDVMRLAIGGQGPKNWLKGSVESVIKPLKVTTGVMSPEKVAEQQRSMETARRILGEEEIRPTLEQMEREIQQSHQGNAINLWIERNLANYIKKQMATYDDPIRKLAEQGIIHMPTEQVGLNRYKAADRRRQLGEEQLGQSEEAKAWEDATDVAFHRTNVGNIMGHPDARKRNGEPWMEKADPKTHLYYPSDSMHAHYLGFDHLVDILKEDLAEGRIRPEQLSKVSIEHAVRRAHEYDQEKKRKMAETALKATEGMPVHKDYGDGFKWIELAMPKELPEGYSMSPAGTYVDPEGKQSIHHPNYGKLEDALKYEGDTMGHCVGGYCSDVAEGRTRIFSLRDAKNEPHVTIEVKPKSVQEGIRNLPDAERQALAQEVKNQHFNGAMPGVRDEDKYFDLIDKHYVSKHGMPPPSIKQIKGKQNAKPKKDYIPYVQDFVKSGKWSEVGDAQNAELRHARDVFNEAEQNALKKRGVEIPSHGYLTGDQIQQMHNAITPEGKRLKYDSAGKIVGGEAGSGFNNGGKVDAEEVFMGKGGLTKFLKGSKTTKMHYHATFGNVRKFDPNAPKQTDQDTGAHFFTPDVEFANKHVGTLGHYEPLDKWHYNKGANIMPVVLHTKNPWDYENPKHVDALHAGLVAHPHIGHEFAPTKERLASGDWSIIEDPAVQETIKKLGHDAFYTEEGGVKNIGVYNRRNIKSAIGNRGTYDRRSADITKSQGGEVDAESYFFPNKE